jgi:pyruvate,orthophosphate dikinase
MRPPQKVKLTTAGRYVTQMSSAIYRFEDIPTLKARCGSLPALSEVIGWQSTSLSEVKSLGVDIPPGFVLSATAFQAFGDTGGLDIPDDLWDDILQSVKLIEQSQGRRFASPTNPLLLSVSGDSPVYLHGMLDSVTHIGLNDLTARGLERVSDSNRPYVWDCYRRVVEGFGVVVLRIPISEFDFELEQFKASRNLSSFTSFTALDYIELTKVNKAIIVRKTGRPFPQDPFEQLRRVITAVFAAQTTERVKLFKKVLQVPQKTVGSAIVQAMVYGNNGPKSGVAVLSSRELVSGASAVVGECITNAALADIARSSREPGILEGLPVYSKLVGIVNAVESRFKYPIVADFVIENGKSWCRKIAPAQLTAAGRFKAAVDLVAQNITTKRDALLAIDADDIRQLLSPEISAPPKAVLCQGVPAGRECIVGKLCLTPEQVAEVKKAGGKAVLVKKGITSADFEAVVAASAVVTVAGTNWSFVAGLTRLLRKTAALGCDAVQISYGENQISANGVVVKAGDDITVTGDGKVIAGAAETAIPKAVSNADAVQVLKWADEFRKDKIFVYTTATTAEEIKFAVDIESDGVGPFSLQPLFEGEKTAILKTLAQGITEEAISTLEEQLTVDLEPILQNAGRKTITIELFVPDTPSYFPSPLSVAREIGILKAKKAKAMVGFEAEGEAPPWDGQEELDAKVAELEKLKSLRKPDSAFGCVGVRHCLVCADFIGAQFRALAFALKSARGKGGEPKIRLAAPIVVHAGEVDRLRQVSQAELEQFGEKASVGALLETPRACLTAGKIAAEGSFVILSVPKLTETVYATTAADATQTWLPPYRDRGIFKEDIFGKMDSASVGTLITKAIKSAREAVADGEIGIYNETFGTPGTDTLEQHIALGVNGIICKPGVVPIVRLCAAKSILIGK